MVTSVKPLDLHQRMIESYLMFLFLWQSVFRVSDVGLGVVLSFIAMFVMLLGTALRLEVLKILPKTVHAGRKLLVKTTDSFAKIVSCAKCSTLYMMDKCIVTNRDGSKTSKNCTHIKFKNHPQQFRRTVTCNTPLMKSVKTFSGTSYLYPRQMYCYKSITKYIQNKLCTPDFIEQCELWRTRRGIADRYEDIFDGNIWREFLNPKGTPFLSLPYNFALCLNVDWFQPFKHSQYSCGAIYLSILNLPRSVRYSAENVILVGVIPGPREPELTINSFLEPLVKELLDLWSGVMIKTDTSTSTVLIRAALLCVACDIPAARKVCGFTGHNSFHACSRCFKEFPTAIFGEKPDYTGFDTSKWPPRSLKDHKKYAVRHLNSNTRTEQKQIEREHGCRYSVLLELPYFDPIRMCIVDPMHNLLLGTAKHMLTVWKELKLFTPEQFELIQQKVDSFHTPVDVGRIPTKISSGFSGFSADQWRNWTLLYSLFSLKDILHYSHYNCWKLFVRACHLLCCRSITAGQIEEADKLLNEFCIAFENLYGKKYLTINLHLHGHLHECLKDFGPVYAFWLFAFERLNGILGSFHTNNHDISLQIMRQFIRSYEFGVHTISSEYRQEYLPLIEKCIYNKGSLKQTSLEVAVLDDSCVSPLPPVYAYAFTPAERTCLVPVICTILGSEESCITILTLSQKCNSLQVDGFLLGSVRGRHKSASLVLAYPLSDITRWKLAKINYFAKCSYTYKNNDSTETTSTSWVACINFFLEHEYKAWFGYPTEIWSKAEESSTCFIPLSHIKSRICYVDTAVNFGSTIGIDSVYVSAPI